MADDRQRLQDHHLDRFWDGLVRGGQRDTGGGPDPDGADAVRAFQRLASAPLPARARTTDWQAVKRRIDAQQRLEETIMETEAQWQAGPRVNGAHGANGRYGPAPTPVPKRSVRRSARWLSLQIATVLLLLVTALFGYLVYRDHQAVVFPPVQETPTTVATPVNGWPMYRGNPARTGEMPGPGITGTPAILWQFAAGSPSAFAPAIAEGTIFLPTEGGPFYALDAATGAVTWQTEGFLAMPSVSNGILYMVSPAEELVALDTVTHEEYWRDTPGSRFWTPLIADGVVYYGSDPNLLIARDARTGEERWRSAQSGVASRSAALADGMLVVGSEDQSVYGIDAAIGATRWQYRLGDGDGIIQTPAISDGTVYVGAFNGAQNAFVALDLQTGAERWRIEGVDGEAFFAPGVAGDLVYVPSDAGKLLALDPTTGQARWTYTSTEAMKSAPVIIDGTVYVAGDDGILLALDAITGAEQWRLALDGPVSFGPNVLNGQIYVGTGAGTFYAIGSVDDQVQSATPGATTATTTVSATVTSVPGTPSSAVNDPTLEHIWTLSKHQGAFGDGLVGLAIDPFGRIWTCNGADASLTLFDRDGNLMTRISGGIGSAPGQWNWEVKLPGGAWTYGCGIAFAPDGTAYVTDGANARIQVLDPAGNPIGSWGTRGAGDGQFTAPAAITRLANGEFLVSDFGQEHDELERYTADGTFLGEIIPHGPDAKPLSFDPMGVVEDGDGNLWVAELITNRVIKMAPDGTLLLSIGGPSPGSGPGQFVEPNDVALDEHGNIYVADDDNRRIQVFDARGTFLAQFDGSEAGITRFGAEGGGIAWIEYGGNGYLYVVEYSHDDLPSGDERLMKLKVTLSASPAATPAP